MVKLPEPDKREIIARAPVVHHDIGEIVAYHDEEGPTIDVRVKPLDTDQYAEFGLSPADARQLADELYKIADAAQRAGWTPAILAEAREKYLPGMSDEEIVTRLDRLYNRQGGFVFGYEGRLDRHAGRLLAIEVSSEALDRASAVVDDAAEQLTAMQQTVSQLAELRASLADVKRLYQAEQAKHP